MPRKRVTYKIVRFFQLSDDRPVIKTGLTRSQAKAHCRNRQTSSTTCTKPDLLEMTRVKGPWFDGFEEE